MSTPFVSVIIPVYNDTLRLKRCLQALETQTYPHNAYEVVVIDNGSDDSIAPIVAGFQQAKASVEMRSGSYAARNKGLSLAQGEVIAFTDADCIPAPDWIERGVATLLNIPNCGIVGGEVELFFNNPVRPTAAELYDSVITRYLDQKKSVEEKRFAATANLFTFRRIVNHAGDFDGNLKSGGDREWGLRVAALGYPIVYAADVLVKHPARHSVAELLAKEKRLAGGFRDMGWKERVPSLTWSYGSIMAHLPPLPPVVRTMRLKHIALRTRLMVLVLWFAIRCIRVKQRWYRKVQRVLRK